ncbi:hypothetical protein ACQKMD_07965 [Viridibacillus sp. NPDC096237]|uniref:hypothetical protein n=1 Tax=Viridibacillus sp. NPDC096237 TaxID=3390721 RepID=UPI003CFCECEC
MLAATIGSTMGLLLKNGFSIFVSIAIYSLFLWESAKVTNTPLHKFFNIFDDYTYIFSNNISGVLFNTPYFLDKLFVVFLILLILFISFSILTYTKRVHFVVYASFSLLAMIVITVLSYENIQSVEAPIKTIKTDTYNIESYKMDLILNKKIENKADIHIRFLRETKNIVFLIDNIFKIKNVTVNEQPVEYSHQENQLIINSLHRQNEEVEVMITYEGNVHVQNDLGVETYYVSYNAINLPAEVFYWYPTTSDKQLMKFDVHVKATTNLYSNLSASNGKPSVFKGSATSINFFAGEYKAISKDGIKYVIPISYNFEAFQSSLTSWLKEAVENKSNDLTKTEIATIKNKDYQKVIVGVWPFNIGYDGVQVVEDTILMNYME